jgi:hypothetical protein
VEEGAVMPKYGAVRVRALGLSAPRRRQVRGFFVVTCRDSLNLRFEASKGVWWLVTAEPSLVQLVLFCPEVQVSGTRVRLSLQICHFAIRGSCYFREESTFLLGTVLHRSAGDARCEGGRREGYAAADECSLHAGPRLKIDLNPY